MNQRALNVILFLQALFIGALLYVGYCSRESRKVGYLELTHRVTAGHAVADDYEKLAGFLPDTADKLIVRSLFGLPVARAKSLDVGEKEKLEGDLWIYYPVATAGTHENPPTPLDSADVAKLSGAIPCFVIQFDERGRATCQKANVMHPIQTQPAATPKK